MTQQVTRKVSQNLSVPQMDQYFHYCKPLLLIEKKKYIVAHNNCVGGKTCCSLLGELKEFLWIFKFHFLFEQPLERNVMVLDYMFFFI